jgi:hypothetical protein
MEEEVKYLIERLGVLREKLSVRGITITNREKQSLHADIDNSLCMAEHWIKYLTENT